MFVIAIILGVIALIALAVARFAKFERVVPDLKGAYGATTVVSSRQPNRYAGFVGGGLLVLALLALGASTFYTQSVGQAKVLINIGGTIDGQDASAGWSAKAPWQSTVNWDLFSQSLTFAGNKQDGAPEYTGGEITGYEITSSVARGAQTNLDLSITYNLDGNKVADLYKQFRSQERFTKQIIEPKVLAVVRTVPVKYTPVEFRGEKRGEATQRMLDGLNEALEPYGVTVTQVNLQNIRYTDQVEDSIKAVEVAQQKEAEAQANLRATQVSAKAQIVEAEAAAEAARVQAKGQADANATLSASLTPQILQQRYLDAIGKSGTVYVVPEGTTPLLSAAPAPAK